MSVTKDTRFHFLDFFVNLICRCLKGKCTGHTVSTDVGHMSHYRSGCSAGIKDCSTFRNNWVDDRRIMLYASDLLERTNRVLR